MKALRKIIALTLIAATLVFCLAGCNKKNPLAKYTEDTEVGKDYYYVAMAIEKYGVIIVKLDAVNAPITTANFVKLVRAGFYDGLTFHRVIDNFMIQGGDPKGDGTGGSSETIIGEFTNNGVYNPLKHERGVISMARSNKPDSASSQFFICNSSSYSVSNLNGNYAAFGYVVEGMEVVDLITSKTAKHGDSNGMIINEKMRATISKMMVIKYEESTNL